MTSRSSSALQATQVAIVGAGPAGLLLGAWLGREGVDHVIVEKHSAAHVLERVRAGILDARDRRAAARAGRRRPAGTRRPAT